MAPSKHKLSPRGAKSQHVSGSEDDFLPGLKEKSGSSVSGGRSLGQSLFKQSAPLAALQQPGLRLGWGQEESASAATPHTICVLFEDDSGDAPQTLALTDLEHQDRIWANNRREGVTTTPFPAAVIGRFAASTKRRHHDFASTANQPSRAAMIVKAKGTSGVLTFNDRKPQKQRRKKPVIDTPAPSHQPAGQVMLRYDNTPEGHQTALKLAIEEGLINPDEDDEVQAFMKTIRETPNRKLKDSNEELDKHITAGGAALGFINPNAPSSTPEDGQGDDIPKE
ncbi:hypothetical protein SNOG_01301 [Parastagonospora nodorum SN15]|uniref:Uncharacterized protein n=1 Tax=Phaeosphaeria nodorum (strain SN15 / ATCC MYA-4574 / FGSC 10173) TaxID=321614 RepID=Q0V3W3_PHANO|nr:hypothetical protein SNOG_01301 [Parastagonospora nodorum SN15]EAT90950.2 hypothetical protein SNOG_01301 [Parastagonospora nodorum SN15]